jgi:polyferredoxin
VIAASVLTLPFLVGPLDPNVWSSFFLFQGAFKPLIIFFLGPLETLIIPYPGLLGFNGYSASYPYIRGITTYFGETLIPLLAVVAFIAVTAVSAFFLRRSWCRFCPTGISIAIVNRFRGLKWAPLLHINKVEEKCTKCGICKRVCPVQVTEVYEQKGGDIATSMCLLCLRCVEMCPYEGCLRVNMGGKTIIHSRNWLEKGKSPGED